MVNGACPVCTPGAPGCGWSDGDVTTYTQAAWGSAVSASPAPALLAANYNSVYASTSGVLEVGIHGTGGFSLLFTSATAIDDFLPAAGTNGILTSDLANPTSSSSGSFGGEAVALKLNIDFADANVTTTIPFGDLTLCSSGTGLDGLSVRQILGVIDTTIGGGTSGFSVSTLAPLAVSLNGSFYAGAASSFAQDHLISGMCP